MNDDTTPQPEPLLDPDCRDGKHGSCVGDPCECGCHRGAPAVVVGTYATGVNGTIPGQPGADRERLLADIARLANRITALEANGAELLAKLEHTEAALSERTADLAGALLRAEHAEDELTSRREHETRWELEKARADAAERKTEMAEQAAKRWHDEYGRIEAERDELADRLRKAESAYGRLDAEKRDLERVRDRLRARVDEAEAANARVRTLRDDWAAGRAPTAAAELSVALDGGE